LLSPVTAGRVMIGVAIIGLVVSVVGGLVGRQLVVDLDRGVEQSLVVAAELVETLDSSFEAADEGLEIVVEGVVEAEGAVRALGRSMDEGQDALDALTTLTGEEIADALAALESTLPAVEQAGNTIDQTLDALSSLPFGLDYTADPPLGESIGEVRESIAGLPQELREQAAQAERTSNELAEATTRTQATADALGELADRLETVSELTSDYASHAAEARVVIAEQQASLATSGTRAQILVLVFSGVFALSQFVPLYLGLALLRGGLAAPAP
jgi:chromosome segregation ATPase